MFLGPSWRAHRGQASQHANRGQASQGLPVQRTSCPTHLILLSVAVPSVMDEVIPCFLSNLDGQPDRSVVREPYRGGESFGEDTEGSAFIPAV